MKQFLLTAAGVFAGMVIFLVGVPLILISAAVSAAKPAPTPANAILELDLRRGLSDQSSQGPLASFGGGGTSVMSVIADLKAATGDARVKGLLIRLPEGGIEPATADELRLAIRKFHAAGKPVIAHSQGFYPSGAVSSTYMLGTSGGEIWMQAGSQFSVTGLATEDIFFKRFFDKYGVTPEYQQRYEYKNAVNGYLYDDYTAAHREASLSWMGSVYGSGVTAAAADRKIDPAALKQTLEAGPYLAEDALRLHLVDKLGQPEDARRAMIGKIGKDAQVIDFDDYSAPSTRSGTGPVVAVIEAEGDIVTGANSGAGNPLAGGSTIYSDDLAGAFYKAAKADDVKAVVFRLNSPGGSDTASEQILAGVRAVKAAGKPVVVSMGPYAASGGYWVSSQASAIVAEPTTLTGSIGVFGGKFAVGEALARFGVDLRQIGVGAENAGAYAMGRQFTPAERAQMSAWMDRIYEGFVARVAEGRKLPVDRVREIAKGHIWTGAQAKELGLVDQLGGFYEAVDTAKGLAKIKGEVRLRRMTPKGSAVEALEGMLGVQASSVKTLAAAAWVLGDPRAQSIIDEAAKARLRERGALVLAPTPLR
jgi:protease-4